MLVGEAGHKQGYKASSKSDTFSMSMLKRCKPENVCMMKRGQRRRSCRGTREWENWPPEEGKWKHGREDSGRLPEWWRQKEARYPSALSHCLVWAGLFYHVHLQSALVNSRNKQAKESSFPLPFTQSASPLVTQIFNFDFGFPDCCRQLTFKKLRAGLFPFILYLCVCPWSLVQLTTLELLHNAQRCETPFRAMPFFS